MPKSKQLTKNQLEFWLSNIPHHSDKSKVSTRSLSQFGIPNADQLLKFLHSELGKEIEEKIVLICV